MKSFRFIQLATVLLLFTTAIKAGQAPQETLYESSRFAIPLIEKWASEYDKSKSGIEIVLTGEKTSGGGCRPESGEFRKGWNVPSKSASVLYRSICPAPVTNEENPLLDAFNRKG